MDIYSFINSNAIAEHCRKLKHQFTLIEMAYLIYQSEQHTILEKHAAWKELIATTLDVEVALDGWKSEFCSLHHFLEQYMHLENQYLERFYHDEPDCVYFYEYEVSCQLENYKRTGGLHKNYTACCQELTADIKDNKDIIDICVAKKWFMASKDGSRDMMLHITPDNIPLKLGDDNSHFLHGEEKVFEDTFANMWAALPIPFEKGDILVCRRRGDEEVLVIKWIPSCGELGYASQKALRNAPSMSVYKQSDDGSLRSEEVPCSMNMEYYDQELTGNRRILKTVSSYLKGKLDTKWNFDIFTSAYSLILCEEHIAHEKAHICALLGIDAVNEKKEGRNSCVENKIMPVEEMPVTGIYSFINSSTIAKHCSKIKHQFTPLEAAYLIHESEKHTIPEKHAAWQKLIAAVPDMEIEERSWIPHLDSLHDFLKQYMQIEHKYIALFYKDEPNCVYSFKYLVKGDSDFTEDNGLYADYSSCYKKIQAEVDDEQPAEVINIWVTKRWLINGEEDDNQELTLCITCDNIPVTIERIGCIKETESDIFYGIFGNFWFDVPIPFKVGDILVNKSFNELVVIKDVPHYSEQQIADLQWNGDSFDMSVGVFMIELDKAIYYTHSFYLTLEYYNGEFYGMERLLIAISKYLKDELDIEALMYVYNLLKYEQLAENERERLERLGKELCGEVGIKI